MNRKPLVAGMASLMVLALLAGCTSKQSGTTTEPTKTDTPKVNKVLRYNAGADFATLDPALMSDLVSFTAITPLTEGLMRQTEKGLVPGLAKEYKMNADGTVYTFTLRDGLKWSNGEPMTAEDFVYSWTRALSPETAADYAYQLYYIKGGEELNSVAKKKKEGDKEVDNPNYAKELEAATKALGVKAVNANTLEVTLKAPTPYFLDLTAFPTLLPVNKKIVEGSKDWANKAETFIGAGPFKIAKWEAKKELVLEPNPYYYDKSKIKLSQIVYYMIEEQGTALQLLESGGLEVMDAPPGAEIPRLTKENKLGKAPSYGTYYYLLNTSKAPFNDVRVRKAFAMAIDRKSIVENVTKGGQIPAYALVAPGATDPVAKKDYREAGGNYFKEDLAEAKKLLAEAGYPEGKGFPAAEIIYNTNETHKAVSEALIEMWKKNLGITELKATNMEFKTLLDKRKSGEYTISRAGWFGDYLDPMTYLDMWLTGGGNNDAHWSNKEYDALIKTAQTTTDVKARFEAMHKAEGIAMNDMIITPLYYYTNLYVQSDKVTGVYRNALGITDFSFADLK
ncbi:MAG TPA: peptide ABC transporter substrate-binding protein [Symbiobacteriaceae bacterium]|nr:peptide ABC transporter substrate-binding protein [Symbiobacteriaceae bacterium]